jgi:hypothetical protein
VDVSREIKFSIRSKVEGNQDLSLLRMDMALKNIGELDVSSLQIKFIGDESTHSSHAAVDVRASELELRRTKLMKNETHMTKIIVELKEVPFNDVKMVVSYEVGGQSITKKLVLPVVPHKTSFFFNSEQARKEPTAMEVSETRELNVDTKEFGMKVSEIVEFFFPNSYQSAAKKYLGTFNFFHKHLVFKYEIAVKENGVTMSLSGAAVNKAFTNTYVSDAIAFILDYYQVLFN